MARDMKIFLLIFFLSNKPESKEGFNEGFLFLLKVAELEVFFLFFSFFQITFLQFWTFSETFVQISRDSTTILAAMPRTGTKRCGPLRP